MSASRCGSVLTTPVSSHSAEHAMLCSPSGFPSGYWKLVGFWHIPTDSLGVNSDTPLHGALSPRQWYWMVLCRVGSRRVTMKGTFPTTPLRTERARFRSTQLSSKSLFHFSSIIFALVNFGVAWFTYHDGFSIAFHHEQCPSRRVLTSLILLFDFF